MTPRAPRFSHYDWGGGREWMMSFGPEDGPQLLIVPPLLEELNRTRKLFSDTMRALADRGVASHLPDLPGTGESCMALGDLVWDDWRQAIAKAADSISATAVFGIRGGCLIDDATGSGNTCRFAPTEGKRLIRDLIRARSVTDPGFDSAAQKAVFEAGTTMLGGYPISAQFASSMRDAAPADIDSFTIRLEGDRGEADAHIEGAALWRRAEPGGSPKLAQSLADAIFGWLV